MTVGADKGEIAEVGSPVDVPGNVVTDAQRPLAWTSIAIVIAAMLLAATDSASMTAWLDERTPTPMVERLRAPISSWDRVMATLRMTTPRDHLHAWWQAARNARFGSEQPGEQGAS